MGVDLLSLVVSITAVFVAGIIRGYSGFGFAMVAVTSMSLVLPPVQVVPTVLILEVLASISLAPQVWRHIDWFSLRWLLIGSLVATPFGVYLLATIPTTPMRISISLLVLAAAILLMHGFEWKRMPGIALILTTGVACGMLNGAAAIGGPPVILFYLSSPAGVTVSRASIIAYFLGIDAMSLVMASIQGLTTFKTLLTTAVCLLPLLFGIAVGSRMFINVDKESFRRHVLILLIILSIAGLFRSIFV
ncbi:MAG: sulfite exporter TauE/SafE family protein [Candidatus Thorarchaeota archaeon]